VLVICPTSLKYQWQSEIARFSGRQGENEVRVINGVRARRQKDYASDNFCKITNYEKLQPDLDLIAGWAPELVIVDEAQRVKNWNTVAARALKRIDSPYVIMLTGTPLENKLEELISIVQFVDQHRLGPTWKLLHDALDAWNETCRANGAVIEAYRFAASEHGLGDRLILAPDIASNYALLDAGSPDAANAVVAALEAENIESRWWYGRGLHCEPYWRAAQRDPLPETDRIAPSVVGLPICSDFAPADIDRTIVAAARAIERCACAQFSKSSGPFA
jgi:hypothetical protein